MTKTGKIDAPNKLNSGPFLEIHPEDAYLVGVKDGELVEVRSRRGRVVLPACVTSRIRMGTCFALIHWNDIFASDLAINAATSDAVDPISKQPELKFGAVQLAKVPMEGLAPNAISAGFSREQRECLERLVSQWTKEDASTTAAPANPPENVPFTPTQRTWIKGLPAEAVTADGLTKKAAGIDLPPTD